MDLEKIQLHNDEQKRIAEENAKTSDMAYAFKAVLDSQKDIEKAIKGTLEGVVKFLNQYNPEVSVTNPQRVPDVQPVIDSVNQLLKEVGKERADFSKVVGGLDKVSKSLSALPTKYPEPKDSIQVTNQIDYTKDLQEIKKAVGNVKAPIVNIPKTIIPDHTKELQDLLKAVKAIKFPDIPKTDVSSVVKAIKDFQKFISGLSIPSGGGGGSSGGSSGGLTDTELRATPVPVSGTVTSTPSGTQDVQGNVAAGVSDSGNPVKAGGKYNATTPTLTDGQRGDLQVGTRGSLKVTLHASDSAAALNILADNADGVTASSSTNKLAVQSRNTVFNGTGWDRLPGDTAGVKIQDGGNSITVDGTVAATQSGTWTEANSAAIKTAVEKIDDAISGSEMQVDVVAPLPAGTNNIGDVDVLSSALPTGAATSAKQDTGNTSLGSIDTKLSSAATEATLDGINDKLPDFSGTWGYAAGTNGTENITGRVLQITAVSLEGAGSLTINGGDSIIIPYGSTDKVSTSITIAPLANLVNPEIVFTGTESYFVEYLT